MPDPILDNDYGDDFNVQARQEAFELYNWSRRA